MIRTNNIFSFTIVGILVFTTNEVFAQIKDNETIVDDRDGLIYKTVKIGTQTWMAENLAFLPAVSPSSQGSLDSALFYVFDYEGSIVSEAKSKPIYHSYGVLYNWEAAKIACPSGWHLPSDEEWTILENNLGALPGKKLKSLNGWFDNGNGDNRSGFNAFPGGCRYHKSGFSYLGGFALFWSSSGQGMSRAWYRSLGNDRDNLSRDYLYCRTGCSVRCIKD